MPAGASAARRGCGALRVGSAWRLERIILLACFVTNAHAFDAAPARRRGGCGSLIDCSQFSCGCKRGVPAATRAITRAAQGAATPYSDAV